MEPFSDVLKISQQIFSSCSASAEALKLHTIVKWALNRVLIFHYEGADWENSYLRTFLDGKKHIQEELASQLIRDFINEEDFSISNLDSASLQNITGLSENDLSSIIIKYIESIPKDATLKQSQKENLSHLITGMSADDVILHLFKNTLGDQTLTDQDISYITGKPEDEITNMRYMSLCNELLKLNRTINTSELDAASRTFKISLENIFDFLAKFSSNTISFDSNCEENILARRLSLLEKEVLSRIKNSSLDHTTFNSICSSLNISPIDAVKHFIRNNTLKSEPKYLASFSNIPEQDIQNLLNEKNTSFAKDILKLAFSSNSNKPSEFQSILNKYKFSEAEAISIAVDIKYSDKGIIRYLTIEKILQLLVGNTDIHRHTAMLCRTSNIGNYISKLANDNNLNPGSFLNYINLYDISEQSDVIKKAIDKLKQLHPNITSEDPKSLQSGVIRIAIDKLKQLHPDLTLAKASNLSGLPEDFLNRLYPPEPSPRYGTQQPSGSDYRNAPPPPPKLPRHNRGSGNGTYLFEKSSATYIKKEDTSTSPLIKLGLTSETPFPKTFDEFKKTFHAIFKTYCPTGDSVDMNTLIPLLHKKYGITTDSSGNEVFPESFKDPKCASLGIFRDYEIILMYVRAMDKIRNIKDSNGKRLENPDESDNARKILKSCMVLSETTPTSLQDNFNRCTNPMEGFYENLRRVFVSLKNTYGFDASTELSTTKSHGGTKPSHF